MFIKETYIDRTGGYMIGETDLYESDDTNTIGQLYRSLRRAYGRCISKVYVDTPNGAPKAIGWVFLKRVRYEDSTETYLREVWVEVHTAPPTVTTEYHYAEVG